MNLPQPPASVDQNHFRFGENWSDFSRHIDPARIDQAEADLARLLPKADLKDRHMLDIGSGSGLSALAALRLGAGAVTAVDLDPDSVATSAATLRRYAPEARVTCRQVSVFDLDAAKDGHFDIVHSWGVLHHTGAMWPAIERAASLVAPGGLLVLALYRKTPVCGFWRVEKRLYSAAPAWLQASARGLFKLAYLAGLLATGRNPATYIATYGGKRGMNWSHDVHDWLGGHPYESAAPAEVHDFLGQRGFRLEREFLKPAPALGLLGSPCDEYVFRRTP